MRPIRTDDDEESQPQNDDDDDNNEGDSSEEFDEAQLLLDYKNLYWSRLMTLEEYESGITRKWPLGRDIVQEINDLAELP